MKSIYSILVCLISLQGSAQNQFTISGKIDTIKSGFIWLTIFYPDTRTIDTVPIINGTYKFTGKINRPYKARLDIADGKADYCNFIIESKTITIIGKGYPLKDWKVKGSVTNDEDKILEKYLLQNSNRFNSLDSLQKITNKNDSFALAKIDTEWDKLYNDRISLKKKFIVKFSLLSRSVLLLEELFTNRQVDKDFFEFFKKLSPTLKKSIIGKELQKYLTIQQKIYPAEIKQKDTLGNFITLSSLKGKYILIDFWASWCNPCREENPALVKLYNKYKSNELEFLSVSYDDNLERWKKAIVEDSLTWQHVSELNGWKNYTTKTYNIFAIPQNVLIDKQGKRIGKNLSNEDLEKMFEKLFSKNK